MSEHQDLEGSNPEAPERLLLPQKPTLSQEIYGISRHHWLPLLAFVGGSLIFLIVDIVCILASRLVAHPGMGSFVRDMPR